MCKTSGTTPSCPKNRTKNEFAQIRPAIPLRIAGRIFLPLFFAPSLPRAFSCRRGQMNRLTRLCRATCVPASVHPGYSTTSKLWLSRNSLST